LLEIPVLYLSRYIIQHKQEYYQRLNRITAQGDWEAWILFMLDAVRETAQWTTQKMQAIRQLMEVTAEYVKENRPKVYDRDLLDLIFVQPYCRIANVVDAGIAYRQTAASYLKELCEIGVLEETKVGREKLFIHPHFLQLLTAESHTVIPYQDY
jgi:Fic family protein